MQLYYSLASLASIVLTVVAYVPYIKGIYLRQVKPHFFSWIIWSLTTSIVFFAQVSAQGGAGAWPTAVSALITIYVAGLAWHLKSDISVTALDRWFFGASLASLPVWFLTADPFLSVVILTTVDTLGFGPTLRKLLRYPHEESLLFYALFALRSLLSVLALESRNPTTMLFPVVMVIACVLVCGLLIWRRRQLTLLAR